MYKYTFKYITFNKSNNYFSVFFACFFKYNIKGIAIPNAGHNAPTKNGNAPTGNRPDLLCSYKNPASNGPKTRAHD